MLYFLAKSQNCSTCLTVLSLTSPQRSYAISYLPQRMARSSMVSLSCRMTASNLALRQMSNLAICSWLQKMATQSGGQPAALQLFTSTPPSIKASTIQLLPCRQGQSSSVCFSQIMFAQPGCFFSTALTAFRFPRTTNTNISPVWSSNQHELLCDIGLAKYIYLQNVCTLHRTNSLHFICDNKSALIAIMRLRQQFGANQQAGHCLRSKVYSFIEKEANCTMMANIGSSDLVFKLFQITNSQAESKHFSHQRQPLFPNPNRPLIELFQELRYTSQDSKDKLEDVD